MGSIPFQGGVTFRVWAPHATSVFVSGDFNSWLQTASPLVLEGNGVWSGDVTGAVVGQSYRYVINRSGAPTVTKRDPYSRVVTDSNYNTGNSLIYDPNAFAWDRPAFARPALKDLVIYEMHMGTFADAAGGNPGTFASAVTRLDAVSNLGFNAVEILPVTEFISNFSSGYNPADQLSIENQGYGGPDGLKGFVRACHDRGLAVIVDIVHNHWGPWDLSTNQFDGWSSTDYPGGIYFYDAARWNSPWGPRPNYSDAMVRQYILDQVTMWTNEYRVDGFRWDSTSNIYNTNSGTGLDLPDGWSLLQAANAAVKQSSPGSYTIAEDLLNNATLTAPVAAGGAGFDAQWHYFASTMRGELSKTSDVSVSLANIRNALTATFNGNYQQRIIYTESHNEVCCDQPRLTALIDPADPASWLARKKSMLGAAILFTAPGIPMIFQGQEFLESSPFSEYVPLHWQFATQFAAVRKMYGDLVKLRRNLTGRTAGLAGDSINVYQVDEASKVMVFSRFDAATASARLIAAANFSGLPLQSVRVGFPRPGVWTTRFNSDSKMYGSDFSGAGSVSVTATATPFAGMPYSATVEIGPYSLILLAQ